jgi:cell division protein FtsB
MTVRRGFMLLLALMALWLQVRLWVRDRVEQQQAANERKMQRNKVLRAETVDLKSGVESIEEKARSEFGLIKKGETFFLLVDKKPTAGGRSTTDHE